MARCQEWELRDQVLMSKVHAIVLKLERSCVLQQVVDRSRILEQHGSHGYFLRMIWMDNDCVTDCTVFNMVLCADTVVFAIRVVCNIFMEGVNLHRIT